MKDTTMTKIYDYNTIEIPIEKITETWEAAFNHKYNPDYFKWRFKSNPNFRKIYIKYIIDNDKLASFYAVSPMIMKDGDSQIKVALSNMTMTHPDHRGHGYFQLLASKVYKELQKDGFACVFTYPVREVSCHIFRKYLNFVDVARLKTMNLSKNDHKSHNKEGYSYEFAPVDHNIIQIAEKLKFSNKRYELLRDEKNLKWRLMDNPINKYYYLKLLKGEKVVQILFVKFYMDSLDIMDYCFSETDFILENDFSVSLDYLFKIKNNAIESINIWTDENSREFKFLENIRFIPTSTNTYFGIIPLNKNKDLNNKEYWHYRYFDSDVF